MDDMRSAMGLGAMIMGSTGAALVGGGMTALRAAAAFRTVVSSVLDIAC